MEVGGGIWGARWRPYPPSSATGELARRRRWVRLGRLSREWGEKEEAVVGWALGTVHLGQCTVAFLIFFLQKIAMHYLSCQKEFCKMWDLAK